MNFKFEKQVNPNTSEVYYEAQFSSKLVSVNAENVLENKNGTQYILGTIEFENAKGESEQGNAMIYMNNWSYGMEVGKTYLTTVRITPGSVQPPLITLSHLTGTARPTADAFGFTVSDEKVTAKVEEKTMAGVDDDNPF